MIDKEARIEELERHLSIMVSTADYLLEQLVNACEDFEEDERVSEEEREETQEQIDDARLFLNRK